MKKYLFFIFVFIFSLSFITAPFGYNNRDLVILRDGQLNDLTDVSVASPTDNYVLSWNATSERWEDVSMQSAGDTNETTRFNTLTGTDCGAGDFVDGVGDNGLLSCSTPAGGGVSWAEVTNGTMASLDIILGFNYYNSTDFSISDYFTSAEVLGFSYYNSTDFDISNYANYSNSTSTFQEDIGSDCVAGDFVKGVDDDGTLDCSTPSGSGDITGVNTTLDSYLYNGSDSGVVYLRFNDTYLNNTIDARGTGDNSSWNESHADTQYVQYNDSNQNVNLSSYVVYALSLSSNFLTNILGTTTIDLSTANIFQPWDDNVVDLGESESGRFKNLYLGGNATAQYFKGDGSLLTNLPSDSFAGSNYSTFLTHISNATMNKTTAWTDLIGVPAGFLDGVDNDSGGNTHLSNFTDDILWTSGFNSTFSSLDQDTNLTEADVDGFCSNNGYFIDIANFTGNLTDTKYCTYDSSIGKINCTSEGGTGVSWAEVINGTMFSQASWDTNYTANNDLWLADEDTFAGSNYSTFLTHITWANAVNGTLAEMFDVLGFSYYNSTDFDFNDYLLTSSWDTNYTANNDLWLADEDSNLTEDDVEAYIFDNDNTANLDMNNYNVTSVDCIVFDSGGKICSG